MSESGGPTGEGSVAEASGTSGTASSGESSPGPGSGEASSDDSSGGSSGLEGCGAGQQCLQIPAGWDGVFEPLAEGQAHCGGGEEPARFVGASPSFDGACMCDCGSASPEACVAEFRAGGAPGSCDDNDEVIDTCTSAPSGGPFECESGSNCLEPAQGVTVESYLSCGGEAGGTVQPAFGERSWLCPAGADEGMQCEGGQCGSPSAPLCITTAGHADACPSDFPVRSVGHESFAEEEVACDCECRDEADCAYQTWYDARSCGVGGGDDDPTCSPPNGTLSMLFFAAPAQGCTAAAEQPPLPELPAAVDPITMCCTA